MPNNLQACRINLVNGILRILSQPSRIEDRAAEMLADRIEALIDEKIMNYLRSTGQIK